MARSEAPGTAAKGRYESAAQRSARAAGQPEKTVKPASSAANEPRDRRAVMVLDSRAGLAFLLARDLPGNAGGGRQELHQGRHLAAGADERLHEVVGQNLLVRDLDSGGEALPLDVLDHRMIGIESARRPLQRILRMAQVHARLLPLGGLVDDADADLLEHLALWHPHPAADEALSRLEVEVVAGSVYALAARLEVRRGVRLVRALVLREPDIAIDPKQRTADAPW